MAKKKIELFNIRDANKLHPPRYVHIPAETEKMSPKELRYHIEREYERWHTGHAGLIGRHYMYVSAWKIPAGTGQEFIRPKWRECDEFIFSEWEKVEGKESKQWLWVSRREIGKSSVGAFASWYYNRMFPGSKSLITSDGKGKIFNVFDSKIWQAWERVDKNFSGDYVKGNCTEQNMNLHTSYKSVNEDGKEELVVSSITGKETTKDDLSAKNFSSSRCKFIWIDEIGLHERRDLVLRSALPTLHEGSKMNGVLMMCGTVEEGIKADSLNALVRMVDNAQVTGMVHVTFTPFWMGSDVNETNGWDDEKGATIKRNKKLAILDQLADKRDLIAHKKNYPASIEEALSLGGDNEALPKIVVEQIQVQDMELQRNPVPISRWSLVLNGDEVTSNPKKDGDWHILEHPQEGVEYIAGIDPIPFQSDEKEVNEEDKKSAHAVWIFKRPAMTLVAYYKERSPFVEEVFRKTLAGQRYYKDAVAMLEVNRGELIRKEYMDKGLRNMLAPTPKHLGIKMTKVAYNVGYWQHRTESNDNVGELCHKLLIKYLMDNTNKILFREFLSELLMYRKANTDLISAFFGVLLYDEDIRSNHNKKVSAPSEYKDMKLPQWENGKLVFKWVKVKKVPQQ